MKFSRIAVLLLSLAACGSSACAQDIAAPKGELFGGYSFVLFYPAGMNQHGFLLSGGQTPLTLDQRCTAWRGCATQFPN